MTNTPLFQAAVQGKPEQLEKIAGAPFHFQLLLVHLRTLRRHVEPRNEGLLADLGLERATVTVVPDAPGVVPCHSVHTTGAVSCSPARRTGVGCVVCCCHAFASLVRMPVGSDRVL